MDLTNNGYWIHKLSKTGLQMLLGGLTSVTTITVASPSGLAASQLSSKKSTSSTHKNQNPQKLSQSLLSIPSNKNTNGPEQLSQSEQDVVEAILDLNLPPEIIVQLAFSTEEEREYLLKEDPSLATVKHYMKADLDKSRGFSAVHQMSVVAALLAFSPTVIAGVTNGVMRSVNWAAVDVGELTFALSEGNTDAFFDNLAIIFDGDDPFINSMHQAALLTCNGQTIHLAPKMCETFSKFVGNFFAEARNLDWGVNFFSLLRNVARSIVNLVDRVIDDLSDAMGWKVLPETSTIDLQKGY